MSVLHVLAGQERPSPRPAVTAHKFGVRPLRAVSNAWQRTAEVAGVVAFGLLISAGVFPW